MTPETPALKEPQQNASAPWAVRSLTRTRVADGTVYRREAEVAQEIDALSRTADRVRRTRLTTDAEWGTPERLREETLVYFLREYARRGDDDTAWQIAEVLTDRITRHLQRKIARWRLPIDAAEDCVRDVYQVLYAALFDLEAHAEFWEVRFYVCLDRRLWTIVEKRQEVADSERRAGDDAQSDDDGGDAEDRLFAHVADRGLGPEAQAEFAAMIGQLNETERAAVYLVYVEGLPEESDNPDRASAGRVLGVTGRSVRNYLRRAREKLERYESGMKGKRGDDHVRRPK